MSRLVANLRILSDGRLLAVLFLVVLLGAGIVGCPPSTVNVPDLSGLEQAAAEAEIDGAGLTVGTVLEANSDTVPAGQVISQTPAAGETVDRNTPVNLVVSSGPGGTPWADDEFTFDVEYAPETVVVEEADLALVLEADADNHIYTLDADGMAARGLTLEVGDILILHGTAIRRVTSLTEEGNGLVVETEFVPLNEVFPSGTIAWDYGVEFTPEKIKAIEVAGKTYAVPKEATPIDLEFEIGELKYHIQATLDTTLSTFTFTITKGVGPGATASLVATGVIQRFRSRDSIQFDSGQLSDFDHQLNGMKGDVTLELVAAASGNNFINVELPATILKIPFVVGLVPVTLNVKVQFVFNASVPLDGSARVTSSFSYDSDLGLRYNGTNVVAGGQLAGIEFGDAVHETGASSAISANFGIGFPRVELSILGDSVVPWAQTAFLVGGSYTFYPACQTADALFLGAAGYNLGLFGLNLFSGSMTFFEEKKPLLRAGDCPEEKDLLTEQAILLEGDPLLQVW